jgi:hypothetical protein
VIWKFSHFVGLRRKDGWLANSDDSPKIFVFLEKASARIVVEHSILFSHFRVVRMIPNNLSPISFAPSA